MGTTQNKNMELDIKFKKSQGFKLHIVVIKKTKACLFSPMYVTFFIFQVISGSLFCSCCGHQHRFFSQGQLVGLRLLSNLFAVGFQATWFAYGQSQSLL